MSEADKATGGDSFDLSAGYEEVESEYIPKQFQNSRPIKEHIECVRALEMRHDDVIVVAFPKSGSHWVWEMVSMLMKGKAQYQDRSKALVLLDAVEVESIQAESSPRLLNSHLPAKLLPRQIVEKQVKLIHVYRNVKDAVVSGYFHFMQTPLGELGLTMDHLIGIFLSEDVPAGHKYITYLEGMDQYHQDHPEVPFFVTAYEEIKQDPQKVIREIAEFLGVEASPQLVKDIAEATTLSKMREANKYKRQSPISRQDVYRKGAVGDWKNHLTVAQSERVDGLLTQLKSTAYHFRYEL